jgi:cellulose synthase/poly-beta-1,6-N-acetylglucosamine synthase-like glycosyltransferase
MKRRRPQASAVETTEARSSRRRTLVSLAVLGLVALLWIMLAVVSGALSNWWPAGAVWVPIGLFGLFRWIVWLSRRIPAFWYRPITGTYRTTAAIIVPIYQEDPAIFELALRSWLANQPDELILVVDSSDAECAAIAHRYIRYRRGGQVLTTNVPGKRAALARGIQSATSEIVVLVDSDTIWAPDTLERILPPFADESIGGVGTRQRVWQPQTLWQRIAQIYLDIRYDVEAPALTRIGRAVSCLSGRTAAYRRAVLLPLLPEFLNERFMGKLCISGEDKRLTSLILRAGYDTYHQDDAIVWSTFPADFDTFLKQRIRWTRNTYRSDLRAMWEGWVWERSYLAMMLVDRMVSPYALLIGLLYLAGALIAGLWAPALVLASWWLVSRAIKILPHLRREPRDVLILPHYVALTFVMAAVKAYSLATIHHHKWLTREVEVVNDRVVHGRPQARDRTPIRTRLAGVALVAVFILIVQTTLFVLGGHGFARADTAPPVIEVQAPAVVALGDPEVTMVVIAVDGSGGPLQYAWVLDGEPISRDATATLPATLAAGRHTWVVYVRDAAGNTATLSGRLEVSPDLEPDAAGQGGERR